MVVAADETRPLYRTIFSLGVVAVLILAVGIGEFVYFAPFGERTGVKARVTGVYAYDPHTQRTLGEPTTRYTVDDDFAAVVDWTSLPASMLVGARWYNSMDVVVGGVGPAPAGELGDRSVVPVKVPRGYTRNLPGEYVFVVERYSGGQPVELLARRLVLVRRPA